MRFIITICLLLVYFESTAQDCSKVKGKLDKFRNETLYSTQINYSGLVCSGYWYGMNGYKFVKLRDSSITDTSYYIRFYKKESSGHYGVKGITVLFEDGTKIQDLTSEVDTDVTSCGTEVMVDHSTNIRIDKEMLNKFMSVKVTEFQVGLCEATIKPQKALEFCTQMKCLSTK